MGEDKGLKNHDAGIWASHAHKILSSLTDSCFISVNETQTTSYSQYFEQQDLLADDNSLTVHGPLKALLSCHKKYPGEPIFALACDMPYMQKAPLEVMLNTYMANPGKDCYLFTNSEGWQTLVAIYSAKLLASTLEKINSGSLANFSLKHMVEISNSMLVPAKPEWHDAFKNVNTPSDHQVTWSGALR